MSFFDKIRRLFGQASSNGDGHRSNGDGTGPAAGTEAGASDSAGVADAECAEAAGGGGAGGSGDEMIPCEEALRLVHEYLDGELENVPQDQVKRHFEVCGQCYPHLRLERSYREAVRRAAAGEAAPPELRERVGRLLTEAQAED